MLIPRVPAASSLVALASASAVPNADTVYASAQVPKEGKQGKKVCCAPEIRQTVQNMTDPHPKDNALCTPHARECEPPRQMPDTAVWLEDIRVLGAFGLLIPEMPSADPSG